jgi:hypothetical protein
MKRVHPDEPWFGHDFKKITDSSTELTRFSLVRVFDVASQSEHQKDVLNVFSKNESVGERSYFTKTPDGTLHYVTVSKDADRIYYRSTKVVNGFFDA